MNKEVISDKQGIYLIIMFVIGASSVITTGVEAKKDLWMANILAVIMTIPLIIIYARLNHLYHRQDLFDILEANFGKIIGKIFSLLYIWFGIHLSALILRDFGEFYVTVAAPKTPMIAPMIIIAFLNLWMIRQGIEAISRFAEIYLPFLIVAIATSVLFLIPEMRIDNLRPVLQNGIKPVLDGAFGVFSFPFAEIVIFTMLFSSLSCKKSIYKVYFRGLLISGVIILVGSTATLLVLGPRRVVESYFGTYMTVRRLSIGDSIQRLEIIVSIIFLTAAFTKMNACLLAACKGVSKVLGYSDYRFIVGPLVLLQFNLSLFISDSIMDFISWSIEIWRYYALLFQVILPVIFIIVVELRKKEIKNVTKLE